VYYVVDSAITVTPSDEAVLIQFDTSMTKSVTDIFGGHPCLDPGFPPQEIARGFWRYAVAPACGWAAVHADVAADPVVHRVIPVYVTAQGGALIVTDLIAAEFGESLTTTAMQAALADRNLHFVDSSLFVHGLWLAALADTMVGSPLPYANELHLSGLAKWASPSTFAEPQLDAVSDPYFQYQHHMNGDYDHDVDAVRAWNIPLADSALWVAVIDDGVAPHEDLPDSRIGFGFDAAAGTQKDSIQFDYDPTPGPYTSHGMACAGILAASHNSLGIRGIFGSCTIIPVKISHSDGKITSWAWKIQEAINYAAGPAGAKVISCSWSWSNVEDAGIKAAILRALCPYRTRPYGCVFVFSAGNNGMDPDWPFLRFPQSMPQVITVGALQPLGQRAQYSAYGAAMDVVALSSASDDFCEGDVFSIDQMDTLGWNPRVPYNCWADPSVDIDYTGRFGGTSAACPQVAGIAALILARRPDFFQDPRYRDTVYRIVHAIIDSSAVKVAGLTSWDQFYGHGVANAYQALLLAMEGQREGANLKTGMSGAGSLELNVRGDGRFASRDQEGRLWRPGDHSS
ncbi:MAG: S8 family serine peptidase, partial [Chloroflexota bacterium]